MGKFRFLTAGESHGKGLSVILEGIPSNLSISEDFIEKDMSRRQKGYGIICTQRMFGEIFISFRKVYYLE